MTVNTNTLVAMTEANQNFSRVTRLVDEEGIAVILKNNKPRYIVVNFDEYDEITAVRNMRKKMIDAAADDLLRDNMDALLELARLISKDRTAESMSDSLVGVLSTDTDEKQAREEMLDRI